MQLIIMGMPGSGASLIVNTLMEMGIYNGLSASVESTLPEDHRRHTVESINLHLLQSTDAAWDRVGKFDISALNEEQLYFYQSHAESLVKKLDNHRPWMLFDVRLCLTAPLWRPLLDQPVYLYVYRNPGEIAAILKQSPSVALALWEEYTVRSLMDTTDVPCLLVSYNRLLKDPVNQIRKLYKALVDLGDKSLSKPSKKVAKRLVTSHEHFVDTIPFREHASDAQITLRNLFRKGKLFGLKAPPNLSDKSAQILAEYERQWTLEKELSEHRSAIKKLQQERTELSGRYDQTVQQLQQECSELSGRYDQTVQQLQQERSALMHNHAQKLATRYQDIAALRAEIAQLRSHLHRTVRLVEKVHHDTRDLFHSWTWTIGRFFVETASRLMFKKPDATARDHMDRLLGDFYTWRDNQYNSLASGSPQNGVHPESPPAMELPVQAAVFETTADSASYNGLGPQLALRPSSYGRTKIIYTAPNLPDFDRSSGGRRATRMLALLAAECDVYVFTIGEKPEKYIQELAGHGVVVIDTYDYQEIKRQIPHVDVLIYAWYYTYFDAEAFRQSYPDAKIIVDSVDVHWVREERSLGHFEELTPEKIRGNKQREIDAYRGAHIVWSVTQPDKDAILQELPEADIRLVSNIHAPVVNRYKEPKQKNILFFGGFGHYPNISAAKLLAEEIFPEVRAVISEANLIIAGAKAPEEVSDLGRLPGVEFRGFIDEDQVDALYRESYLVAAPLLMGAGIKGKICEAIAYMTPVVTNAIGNEGMHLKHGEEGLITDDFREMADLIIQAMQGRFDLASMTQKAQEKLHALVGPDIVKERMLWSIKRGVSICIVTHNRLQLLMRCIDSILENTTYCNYKIFVYSNGCTDGTQDYLRELAQQNNKVVPILSDENNVFVKPNNEMMMRSPDSDIVLLNNDVYVTPDWLNALHRAAYTSDRYGVAGSKILYPDGRLQEFGSEIYADGTGRNVGKNDDPGKPEYNTLTETGYVSGCAMFIKRSTISKIGVFDEAFHPCYFEDTDFCYTAKEHGLMTVVTPDSIVYHDEGGTAGKDTGSGFKKYQIVNAEKFIKKHAGKNNGINWHVTVE